jgi:hypothetical protein
MFQNIFRIALSHIPSAIYFYELMINLHYRIQTEWKSDNIAKEKILNNLITSM